MRRRNRWRIWKKEEHEDNQRPTKERDKNIILYFYRHLSLGFNGRWYLLFPFITAMAKNSKRQREAILAAVMLGKKRFPSRAKENLLMAREEERKEENVLWKLTDDERWRLRKQTSDNVHIIGELFFIILFLSLSFHPNFLSS